uniref:Putative secreted protein n=1 Tax=Ixodes ricinus TaxID=34613 RepID=A0A6B0UDS1_IXORI
MVPRTRSSLVQLLAFLSNMPVSPRGQHEEQQDTSQDEQCQAQERERVRDLALAEVIEGLEPGATLDAGAVQWRQSVARDVAASRDARVLNRQLTQAGRVQAGVVG